MSHVTEYTLNRSLEPLCPRDDHPMSYEAKGISWKARPEDESPQTLPSYHCEFEGCSVRYDLMNGYFTVVNTPDMPFFIEEPGVNLFQCPRQTLGFIAPKTARAILISHGTAAWKAATLFAPTLPARRELRCRAISKPFR